MATLRVQFHEGFKDDHVVALINGRMAYDEQDLTTNLSSNIAAIFTIEVPNGPVKFDIRIPSKDLAKIVTIQVSDDLYAVVSIVGQNIQVETSHNAPRVM